MWLFKSLLYENVQALHPPVKSVADLWKKQQRSIRRLQMKQKNIILLPNKLHTVFMNSTNYLILIFSRQLQLKEILNHSALDKTRWKLFTSNHQKTHLFLNFRQNCSIQNVEMNVDL